MTENEMTRDPIAELRREVARANARAAEAELEARAWKAECKRIEADWRERMRFEAAKVAMGGLLADSCGNVIETVCSDGNDLKHIATLSVRFADALLAELAKPQAQEATRE